MRWTFPPLLEGVFGVLREMAGQYPDIAGIGVTSFGETFVMTDGEGKPLHTAMLYTDPRGARQCARLREKIGEKEIARITGLRPHEMYSISKLMWIRENGRRFMRRRLCLFDGGLCGVSSDRRAAD